VLFEGEGNRGEGRIPGEGDSGGGIGSIIVSLNSKDLVF
jgi:hypothetical protein